MSEKARMCLFVIFLIICAGVTTTKSTTATGNTICEDLPEEILIDILGPAYNSRYMSIKEPLSEIKAAMINENSKRKVNMIRSFYVDEHFAEVLVEEPAWSVNHFEIEEREVDDEEEDVKAVTRIKRAVTTTVKQWECDSKIIWKDLGHDYFPRYLRTVECTSKKCWYGHFLCKPRSFTVKILRRRRDRCTTALPNTRIGTNGLHRDLRWLWVWEEHAVNFCCDCSL